MTDCGCTKAKAELEDYLHNELCREDAADIREHMANCGDCSGEPLDSDERSEPDEWMDCNCSSSVSASSGGVDDMGGWQILATYIILSEQVEGAEHLVVLDVE